MKINKINVLLFLVISFLSCLLFSCENNKSNQSNKIDIISPNEIVLINSDTLLKDACIMQNDRIEFLKNDNNKIQCSFNYIFSPNEYYKIKFCDLEFNPINCPTVVAYFDNFGNKYNKNIQKLYSNSIIIQTYNNYNNFALEFIFSEKFSFKNIEIEKIDSTKLNNINYNFDDFNLLVNTEDNICNDNFINNLLDKEIISTKYWELGDYKNDSLWLGLGTNDAAKNWLNSFNWLITLANCYQKTNDDKILYYADEMISKWDNNSNKCFSKIYINYQTETWGDTTGVENSTMWHPLFIANRLSNMVYFYNMTSDNLTNNTRLHLIKIMEKTSEYLINSKYLSDKNEIRLKQILSILSYSIYVNTNSKNIYLCNFALSKLMECYGNAYDFTNNKILDDNINSLFDNFFKFSNTYQINYQDYYFSNK